MCRFCDILAPKCRHLRQAAWEYLCQQPPTPVKSFRRRPAVQSPLTEVRARRDEEGATGRMRAGWGEGGRASELDVEAVHHDVLERRGDHDADGARVVLLAARLAALDAHTEAAARAAAIRRIFVVLCLA